MANYQYGIQVRSAGRHMDNSQPPDPYSPGSYHPPVINKTAAPFRPYAHPAHDDYTAPKQRMTYSPVPPPSNREPIYHNQNAFSPQPPSPGPPPYSKISTDSRPLQYKVTANVPETQYYQSQQPPLSTYQDQTDMKTAMSSHTPNYPQTPPEAVSSRLVYSSRPTPQSYVQSRPTNSSPAPHSQLRMSQPNPRPYQLKPTLDSARDDAHQPGDSAGTEVDALTDLLMKNMNVSGDPDFFGMCAKCGQSIMGQNTGCTALDQLFHIQCFTCVCCDACLRGQPFFAMEGKPYCEACYLNTLEKCSVCSKPITDRVLRATGKPYHPDCFKCVVCGKSLDGIPFTVDATSQIHCIEDFHRKFAPRCCVCEEPIIPSKGQENLRVVCLDRSFHMQCYRCEDCGVLLISHSDEGEACYPLDDHILCQGCNAKRINALTTKLTTEL